MDVVLVVLIACVFTAFVLVLLRHGYVHGLRQGPVCDHDVWKRMPLCDHARGSWRCLGMGCEYGVACSHLGCSSFVPPPGWDGEEVSDARL